MKMRLLCLLLSLLCFTSIGMAQDPIIIEEETKDEELIRKEERKLQDERLKDRLEEESYREGDEALKIIDDIEDYGKDIWHKLHRPSPDLMPEMPDETTPLMTYTPSRDERWWWTLFKQGKLKMNDTTVVWPKFLKFCVDVYNWGDKTFNSYDPEYVIGTGKRWKARIVSDNWLDTYAMKLPQGIHTTMSSNVYANLGAYIQYMAVSIGTTFDVEKLFNKKEPSHNKYEFGFICALFNAELYYHENRGGVNIRKFGKINEGKLIKEYFPGVSMYTLGFDIYYFFNNKKYSQGAAYNFAKYQLKSQGSFLLGFSLTNQKLSFDFSKLPDKLKEYLPNSEITNYYFHYNSFALLAGYGYNWVIAPKLLFNITAMPSIGVSRYYADSYEGKKYLLSLNIQGRVSLTYNLGNYYFGLFGKMNGHLYKQGGMSLFSSIENFSAYIGLRF